MGHREAAPGIPDAQTRIKSPNEPPEAVAGGPYLADLGQPVTLDGTGSFDPNEATGDLITYQWLVAGTISLSGPTPALTAAQVDALGLGTYPVQLTVTDGFGETDTDETTLSIYDNRPFAAFTADPNPCACNESVIFDASTSIHGRPDRAIVNYEWDFDGDGTYDVSSGTPVTTYAFPRFGTYTVALRVTDNNTPPKTDLAVLLVNVNLGNLPPVADPGGDYLVDEGSGLTLDGSGSSDPNEGCGDTLTYAWDLNGDGSFDDGEGPLLELTPASDAQPGLGDGPVERTIWLRVTDTFGETDTQAALIRVNNVAPTAHPEAYAVDEDKTLRVPPRGVLTNDTDPGSDTLTAVRVDGSGTSHGTLVLDPDGSFTYTPDPNWYGIDIFQYRAFDGCDYSDPATVTITVDSVNDVPTFSPGTDQVVDEDAGPQTIDNWATDVDPGPNESGQSVWFVVTNDNIGLFSQQPSVLPDGTLTYTPAPNAYGGAIVTVVLHDSGGTENGGVDTSEPQTFIIMVNSVIDAVIDVKPGSDVNPINLGANGVLPIAILSTHTFAGEIDDFDARTVKVTTIKLNGVDIDPVHAAFEDIDGDGDLDLILHFSMEELRSRGALDENSVDLLLSAEVRGRRRTGAGSDGPRYREDRSAEG